MTSSAPWGLPRRIGFRFVFIVAALYVFPFPLGLIPKASWLGVVLTRPMGWATDWLGGALGLPALSSDITGSGDRLVDYVQLLLIAMLAVLGTIVWSVVDRRRRSYVSLATATWTVLRYFVAWAMLSYGMSKVMKSQFYDLSPGVLHQRVGETPPMKLLWAFMGYSLPYTVFAGLAEVIGGVLLLWRRTATLGALLVIAVMTNVVMLNFCYDVPVKLYSMQLLVMAIAIAQPAARRLIGAALGGAVAEVPARTRMSPRLERARIIAKLLMIAGLLYDTVVPYFGRPGHEDHLHEVYGDWAVDSFVIDGVDHPPVLTDPVRWESWSANPRYSQIWLMDGSFEGRNESTRGWYTIKVDPAAHTIEVTVDSDKQTKETWNYVLASPDHLVIDCVHRGKSLQVAMHRRPAGLLLSRGFHWINEVPYNR